MGYSLKNGSVRVGILAIFGKHSGDYIDNNSEFGLVRCRYVDEDISRVQSDLTVLGIDDRRHR